MKKTICMLLVLLCMTGCSKKEEDVTVKKTTCTMENKVEDVVFQTTQEIEYVGDTVRSQKQSVTAQFQKDDKDAKKNVETSIKENSEKYKDIKGMSFEASINDDHLYKEVITFDFNTISVKDYGTVTDQKLSGDKLKIDYQQSKNNLTTQGFVCSE